MTPEQLSREADRCVKCGLCLPHCPTYTLTRDEGDSPRGRIALIQGFLEQGLRTPRLIRHLDRCLGCRRCETRCPSGVRYGEIIDAARALGATAGGRRRRPLLWLLTHAPYWRPKRALVRHYRDSTLRRLLRRLGGAAFRRLDDMLPTSPASGATGSCSPPSGDRRVALFTGCVGRIADDDAIAAAIRVLNVLSITALSPADQGCCGAMHLHNGFPARARSLAEANGRAFAATDVETVLYLASGCGAQLAAYPSLGIDLGAPAVEIARYLEESELARQLPLASCNQPVALHIPCTQRYPLEGGGWTERLLRRIPGIDLHLLPDTGCCGAAGTQVLTQPDLADRLREPLLDAVLDTGARLLLTSNSGCAMHLRAGLRQRDAAVEVLHPIELIARQLTSTGP